MINSELLLEMNKTVINKKDIKIKNGVLIYRLKTNRFDGLSVKKLISFVNTISLRFSKIKMPIVLDFGEIEFVDKLTYIFLEIICYILIKDYGHPVQVIFSCRQHILTEGIQSSPMLLLNKFNKRNMKKYLEKFDDDIYLNHYRKVLKPNQDNSELSKILGEISYFLKYTGVDEQCTYELSEVMIELIGNVWEHTSSECLVDIDVTNSYFHRESSGCFMGINIVVLNFSKELLGDAVKYRLENKEIKLPARYKTIENAYVSHKKFFNESYTENDFFNIASFQHKISGRLDKDVTGGTGLTKLISSLEKRSNDHKCYLITGDRALWFKHEFLEYDDDGWIGFNRENNFINNAPNEMTIDCNSIYMPGTAYNLNFIMKRREEI